MVADKEVALGVTYKNNHYIYSLLHEKTKVEKDEEIIFEAGEETMPK